MILGTKGRYAVMAMVEIALHGEGKVIALQALSEAQEIPLAYLEQIFSKLKNAELVSSVRGPGGGYKLARAAADISIIDIIIASEEAIKITRCNHEGGCMSKSARCITHDLWEGLDNKINDYFGNISLLDVSLKNIKAQNAKKA